MTDSSSSSSRSAAHHVEVRVLDGDYYRLFINGHGVASWSGGDDAEERAVSTAKAVVESLRHSAFTRPDLSPAWEHGRLIFEREVADAATK